MQNCNFPSLTTYRTYNLLLKFQDIGELRISIRSPSSEKKRYHGDLNYKIITLTNSTCVKASFSEVEITIITIIHNQPLLIVSRCHEIHWIDRKSPFTGLNYVEQSSAQETTLMN